jgi:hypothetical protein
MELFAHLCEPKGLVADDESLVLRFLYLGRIRSQHASFGERHDWRDCSRVVVNDEPTPE